MSESSQMSIAVSKQMKVVAIALTAITVVLIVCYFLFSRFNYDVLFQNLKPADASLAIAELDLHEINYRLENRGADIYVSAKDLPKARLAIIGSETPAKTTLGFELFNESEMGLTDFAQKIKYQRALQGELSRTIMMMKGIEAARVHISMPERALFRNHQSHPRAAVTLLTEPEYELENSQILGIQSLIASSVNNMNLEGVVILNDSGGIVNAKPEKALPELATQDKPEPLLDVNDVQKIAVNVVIPTLKPEALARATASEKSLEEPQGVVPVLVVSQEKAYNEIASTSKNSITDNVSKASIMGLDNIRLSREFWTIIAFVPGGLVLVLLLLLLRRSKALTRKEHMAFAERLKLQLENYKEPFDVAA